MSEESIKPARKPLSKKLRFEVFKRDSFCCQYCGQKAPEVILSVDHIQPVSKGGNNSILNLITSCIACNAGKSDRTLSDNTVISKQVNQLSELQEKKDQIEMMFEWQKSLMNIEADTLDKLYNFLHSLMPGTSLSEDGKALIAKVYRKFGLELTMKAIKIAAQNYIIIGADGKADQQSCGTAIERIGGICAVTSKSDINPAEKRIYYIRGILRKRLSYCNESQCIQLLHRAVELNLDMEYLEKHSKSVSCWSKWKSDIEQFISEAASV